MILWSTLCCNTLNQPESDALRWVMQQWDRYLQQFKYNEFTHKVSIFMVSALRLKNN